MRIPSHQKLFAAIFRRRSEVKSRDTLAERTHDVVCGVQQGLGRWQPDIPSTLVTKIGTPFKALRTLLKVVLGNGVGLVCFPLASILKKVSGSGELPLGTVRLTLLRPHSTKRTLSTIRSLRGR